MAAYVIKNSNANLKLTGEMGLQSICELPLSELMLDSVMLPSD